MLVLILRRVGNMILIMLAVSVVLFLLLEINGDSVAAKVLGAFSTDEQRRLWLEANGYGDPVYIRYFRWLSGFLNGNLGESTTFRAPVSEVLWPRVQNTAILGALAMAVIIPLSLALGVIAGYRRIWYGSPLRIEARRGRLRGTFIQLQIAAAR